MGWAFPGCRANFEIFKHKYLTLNLILSSDTDKKKVDIQNIFRYLFFRLNFPIHQRMPENLCRISTRNYPSIKLVSNEQP